MFLLVFKLSRSAAAIRLCFRVTMVELKAALEGARIVSGWVEELALGHACWLGSYDNF